MPVYVCISFVTYEHPLYRFIVLHRGRFVYCPFLLVRFTPQEAFPCTHGGLVPPLAYKGVPMVAAIKIPTGWDEHHVRTGVIPQRTVAPCNYRFLNKHKIRLQGSLPTSKVCRTSSGRHKSSARPAQYKKPEQASSLALAMVRMKGLEPIWSCPH